MHQDEFGRAAKAASDFTLREEYAIRMFARMTPEKRERAIAAIKAAAQEDRSDG